MKLKIPNWQTRGILLLVAGHSLIACGDDTDSEAEKAETTTSSCMTCHDGTSPLSQKILSAEAGWAASTHANGQRIPILDQYYDSATGANEERIAGWYWGGSMSFMGNGSSCQTCHTNEGFVRLVGGGYPEPSDQSNTEVDGLPMSLISDEIVQEVIGAPSPPGCFTCHSPHSSGDFELRIPNGTPIQTSVLGTTYSKSKGSICVSCHSARVMNGRKAMFDSVLDRILSQFHWDSKANVPAATPGGLASLGHYDGHYGVQSDVHLGSSGATYAGRDYTSNQHPHSTEDEANCVSCHMNLRSDMMSHLSANLGGHSFDITAPTRAEERANYGGCEGSSCHNIVKREVTAVGQDSANGYLREGLQAFVYTVPTPAPQGSSLTAGSKHNTAAKLSDIMVQLADPSNGCDGLLQRAFEQVTVSTTDGAELGGSSILFHTDAYDRCHVNGYAIAEGEEIPLVDTQTGTVVDWDTHDSTRLLKALWNFTLITNDKSQGLHNPTYALRLLYDTCEDLHLLVGGAPADLDVTCNDYSTNRP